MQKRITIIDDSKEATANLLEIMFAEDVEIQPITYVPPLEERGEKLIKQFDPNLIVLGLNILDSTNTGFMLLKQLKKSKLLGAIPVVVWSKFVSQDETPSQKNRKKALKLGAVAVLDKIPPLPLKTFSNLQVSFSRGY